MEPGLRGRVRPARLRRSAAALAGSLQWSPARRPGATRILKPTGHTTEVAAMEPGPEAGCDTSPGTRPTTNLPSCNGARPGGRVRHAEPAGDLPRSAEAVMEPGSQAGCDRAGR